MEPSFVGHVIDRMVRVPDAASVATMREVEAVLGRRVGPSTGTNLWACLRAGRGDARDAASAGSIVTLLCDSGERYARTYYDDDWVAAQGWDLAPVPGGRCGMFLVPASWPADEPIADSTPIPARRRSSSRACPS